MKNFLTGIFFCLGLHVAALTLFFAPQVLAQGTVPATVDAIQRAEYPTAHAGSSPVMPVANGFHDPHSVEYAQYADPFSMSNSPSFESNPDGTMSGGIPHEHSDFISGDCVEEVDWLPFGLTWTKHRFVATVLPGTDSGIGLTTIDLSTQFSLKSFPLAQVTPRFGWNFFDGPSFTDVPNQLYEAAVDFSLFLPLNEKWSFYGGVAPGIYSDFENTSSDALRITGRALFTYKRSEQLKLSFGFVYLDRDDVSALPAAGLIYKPASMPNVTFDIMFPRPRISYRYYQDGVRERSLYLAGEFGGGTWAIERSAGPDDTFTYSDLRLAVGLDQSLSDDFSWFAEAGYVFSRNLEYASGGEFDLDDTGMIRIGLKY